MPTQRIEFTGARGQVLAARLDSPESTPRAYALFAHCFTCGKDLRSASTVAAALTAHGIAMLRFDFTGLGGSEGDFANTDFSSNIDDLLAAAAFMRDSGRPVSLLIGHSLGGAAVLAAAGAVPGCRGVAVIGAPFRVDHVLENFGSRLADIEREGEATVSLAGRPFRIQRSFVDDARNHDQAARISALGRSLLVLHSPRDEVVGIDNARQIFESARHPKSFVSLDQADHLLTRGQDAQYAATIIAAWAARFLPEPEQEAPGAAATGAPVTVSETGAGVFQQAVVAGRHRFFADEPRGTGGLDSGPSPYDFLLAALGACTAMTLRLYARRKDIALTHVSVGLSHQRIHAEDCRDCESASGRVDLIRRWISLEGDLSTEQRRRLLEIADRCPVHRTLEAEVRVVTEETEPGDRS